MRWVAQLEEWYFILKHLRKEPSSLPQIVHEVIINWNSLANLRVCKHEGNVTDPLITMMAGLVAVGVETGCECRELYM